MKYKHIIVLVILVVSLLAVSVVSATDNATSDVVSVEETTDDVVSVGDNDQVISDNESDVGTFDDLANEIKAIRGGVLNLTKDYKYVNGSTDGIQIKNAITIDGQGHTLDGNNVSRIIMINSKNVLLKNIIFINGRSEDGGAIINKCSLVNCTFINNSAGRGGAIYSSVADANYQVTSCVFVNNSAIQYGGAMYECFATNCNFTNNFAGRYGGAMYEGSATNCNFTNNSATYHGGASFRASVINCVFVNNTAEYGGASYMTSSTSCVFLNNAANVAGAMYDGSATDCVFVNNTAMNGGAICRGSATNCNFTNNSATYQGGASYRASVINCVFENNTAKYGGAICEGSAKNCNFTNNSATYKGGASYKAYVINCVFLNNTAEYGGAICEGSAKNFTFINNSARILGNDTYETTLIQENPIIYSSWKSVSYMEDFIFYFDCNVDGIAILKIGETYIKNITVVANNWTKATFYGIPAGDYIGTITLKPTNYNYAELTDNFGFRVFKKQTNVTLNVIDSIFGEDVIVNLTASENGNVTLNVGNITHTENVLANISTAINLGVLSANLYDANVSFNAGPNYEVSTQQKSFIITPAKSEIVTIEAQNNTCGENTIISVKTNVGGILTVKINNIVKTFDIGANKLVSFDLGKYDANTYDVDLTLDAGANYTQATGNTKVTVNPKTTVSLDVNDEVYGNNVVVKVTASEKGKVTVQVDNIVKSVEVEANKVAYVDFGVLDANSYEVSAIFDGGKNFNTCDDKDSFEIFPKSTVVILNTKEYLVDENVIVNVTASENGKVTLKLNNIVKTVDVIANKLSSVDFGILGSGSYDVIANFVAGNNYVKSIDTANIKVLTKIDENDVDIKVPEIKPNQENNIVINLPADATGTVTLTIGNNSYSFTVKDGVADIKIPKLSDGNYDYKINYSGDSKYSSFEKTDSITVAKPTHEIVIPPLDEPSDDGSVTVNLPKDATGTVTLVINGKAYSFPVVNGVANVYMPELNAGNYNYSITYSGDGKYSTFTSIGSVKVYLEDTFISASSVTVVYNGEKYGFATFKDKNNNPISGLDVGITTNGKTSIVTTDEDGQVKFSANGLKPGVYTSKIVFSGTSKYRGVTKTIKVAIKKATPKITAAKKTFKRTLKTKKYTITLKTNQNKVMKNTKVTIKVKGKTYSAKTNSKGKATFKITKLTKKGKFNAVVTYKGNTYYNKVTKKVQITIK